MSVPVGWETTSGMGGGGRDDGEASTPPPTDWRDRAACGGVDPRIFDGADEALSRQAARICAGCPARADCLTEARARKVHREHGDPTIRAGRRGGGLGAVVPLVEVVRGKHGTRHSYRCGCRCDACVDSERSYNRQRWLAKRVAS